MRALLVLVLLATTASADDVPIESRASELRYVMERRRGVGCVAELDELRAAGVPDSTTIFVRETRYLRGGVRSLADLRIACVGLTRAKEYDDKVYAMKSIIIKALRFPASWVERCLQAWPEALAAGVKPSERIELRTSSRRGVITFSGTLEHAFRAYCEHAYTPTRRPHR